MCEAIWKNDLATARSLHHELFEINRAVFFDTNPIPIKYMMKRLGILATNEHRLPMVPATADLEQRLDNVLARAGLLGASTTNETRKLRSSRARSYGIVKDGRIVDAGHILGISFPT